MSRTNDRLRLEDDAGLDRLVDGELSETERRALLSRLESEPGGWRRCALAFLEAQTWRQVLGPLAGVAVAQGRTQARPAAVPIPASTVRQEASWPRSLRHAAVRVAGVLLVFGLGLVVGGAGRPAAPRSAIVNQSPPRVAPDTRPERPAQNLARKAGQEIPSQPVEAVPARDRSDIDPAWLTQLSPAMPAALQRQWEQRGYHVETRRQLVSVSVGNGRRVAFPVDQVELHYVGQRAY